MVIQPTAACPLGCGYCGQKHSNKNMNETVQKATLMRLEHKLKSGFYKSMAITWFGAEPLVGLKVIKNLSLKIIALAKKYDVRYRAKIITNGFLLTSEVAEDLLTNCWIDDYEITLDGTAIFHNQRRHTKAMGASFDIIYKNLKKLTSLETAKIIIRCNVDHRNKEGVIALLKQLYDDNLHQRIHFYAAPIHSWGNDAHLLAAEKKEFSVWEIDWLIEMKKFGFATHYLPQRTKSICFAVNPAQELIDPYGEIHGCSEVSLVPSYVDHRGNNIHKLGHVEEGIVDYQKRTTFGDFYKETQIKKFDCARCRMLPTCGGGCPKEWVEGRMPCPSTKFNIEQRILLAYLAN